MYTLLKKEGKARRGQFETVHGTFQRLSKEVFPLLIW